VMLAYNSHAERIQLYYD